MTAREKPYRLSLKWRAFALTSLVLLALAASIAWISYANLMNQFEARQRAAQQDQRQLMASALDSSASELGQLAAIIAASESLEEALRLDEPDAVAQALRTQWPTLQLNAGIEEMLIFDVDGRRLARYGGEQIEPGHAGWQRWVRSIIERERPDARTVCLQSCRQYVAVPILVAGGNAGVLVASRSLVDVLDYFQRSSGNDIALLTRAPRDGAVDDDATPAVDADGVSRTLAAWNARALALTHQGNVLPLLARIAERQPLEALVDSPGRVEYGGRDFEVIAMPLEGNRRENLNRQGFFVAIEDVTLQLGAIERTTRMMLLASLIGWLVAEMFLLFILWRPVRRIRLLSRYLPGLASGDFERFRERIARRSRQPARDEIDVLADTTVELSYQLEALESEVTARGQMLERQVSELERERDLVSALMDSAEALVVVHDAEDRILLANHHALRMIGINERSLQGESFQQRFLSLETTDPASPTFDGQQESDLLTGDGQRRAIAWYHSGLKAWSHDSPAIVSVGLDITERKTAEMRLAWLAHRDPLTELYNRRYFEETLAAAVVEGAHGAMLYLDLDRFREVNELGGHQAGDQLLMRVAEVFRRQLGHVGTVARLGGDEFAVLMERAEADQALVMAHKIIEALTSVTLEVEGQCHRAMASIGIALYPDHGATPKELMASADFAMYRAKANPEQRWHLLTSRADRHALQERILWEEKIRRALAEDGFQLWQQPIMRLADHAVTHHEVLLRLPDPVTGEIASPGWFISIAESSGQIVALDRWVLSQTLRHMRQAGSDARFAVNLSGQSLRDGKLIEFLRGELDTNGIDPRRLIVEVTETAAVTDFSTARYILQGLRSLGCRVALDDFGVGFSSFYYLDQLPADYIKIDGSFIQDLPENRRSQMIVKAIVEIARGLGKSTVAEFVDRAEIVEMLRAYGVNYAQGYWIGRPAPINATL
ncbi:EAL domain-containing protein [Salinicola halophilus]|uniref:bifunctional diguanylate cyclase/phosphodiesterase n=1 Tax=Salinicola halophilus TaxID=184065 RepID=UPI000DA17699|nr:EAL domain-containing protein [Salinicola halophilus]